MSRSMSRNFRVCLLGRTKRLASQHRQLPPKQGHNQIKTPDHGSRKPAKFRSFSEPLRGTRGKKCPWRPAQRTVAAGADELGRTAGGASEQPGTCRGSKSTELDNEELARRQTCACAVRTAGRAQSRARAPCLPVAAGPPRDGSFPSLHCGSAGPEPGARRGCC